jgi:hypothetical protein
MKPVTSLLRLLSLCLLAAAITGCTTNRRGDGGGDDDDGPSNDALATELSITRITLNQGVALELMDNGEETNPDTEVIRDRPGLLRVFVERGDDWEDREINAEVSFYDGDGEFLSAITETKTINEDSSENDTSSTINIEIEAEEFQSDTHFRVTLIEADGDSRPGSSSGAQWPEESDEYQDLNAKSAGGPLKIILVPVQYNADGSGRLPDTSEDQIAIYRDWLMRLYPASEIEIDVQSPLAWNSQLSPFGGGWSQLLESLVGYRQSSNLGRETYVYGIFNPASSFANFCGAGCVAGLSLSVQNPGDDWARVSIGLGFSGEDSASTMVHELGHAHGREHAPCGLGGQQSDPGYPYSGASIGVWGWDVIDRSHRSPNTYLDIMSYCSPGWVSDYTYDAYHDRMVAVGAMASVIPGEDGHSRWQTAIIEPSGSVLEGSTTVESLLPPSGESQAVRFLDKDGQPVSDEFASFHPFDHLEGGILLYPEPGEGVDAVQLEDGQIVRVE